jgi:hypothetical protein
MRKNSHYPSHEEAHKINNKPSSIHHGGIPVNVDDYHACENAATNMTKPFR